MESEKDIIILTWQSVYSNKTIRLIIQKSAQKLSLDIILEDNINTYHQRFFYLPIIQTLLEVFIPPQQYSQMSSSKSRLFRKNYPRDLQVDTIEKGQTGSFRIGGTEGNILYFKRNRSDFFHRIVLEKENLFNQILASQQLMQIKQRVKQTEYLLMFNEQEINQMAIKLFTKNAISQHFPMQTATTTMHPPQQGNSQISENNRMLDDGEIKSIKMVDELLEQEEIQYLCIAFKYGLKKDQEHFYNDQDEDDSFNLQRKQAESLLRYNSQNLEQNNLFVKAVTQSIKNQTPSTLHMIRYLLQAPDEIELQQWQHDPDNKQQFVSFNKNWDEFVKIELKNNEQLCDALESSAQQLKQFFQNPVKFTRLLIFMYCKEQLYKKLNERLIKSKNQELSTEQARSNSFSAHLTSLIIRGNRAILQDISRQNSGLKNNGGIEEFKLFRGVRTDPLLNENKEYWWPALTSTTTSELKTYAFGGMDYLFNIQLIKRQQTSHGLRASDWFLDLRLQYFKELLSYAESEILLIPGFHFQCLKTETNQKQKIFKVRQKSD